MRFLFFLFCMVVSIFLHFDFSQIMAAEKPLFKNGESIYKWYCTPCHGDEGNGNGFNAKNLDPRPANHTDPKLMTRRTDEELSDAISGGGRRVGKSTLMPPWGNTFDKAKIKSLVQYLRKLCKCVEE